MEGKETKLHIQMVKPESTAIAYSYPPQMCIKQKKKDKFFFFLYIN